MDDEGIFEVEREAREMCVGCCGAQGSEVPREEQMLRITALCGGEKEDREGSW